MAGIFTTRRGTEPRHVAQRRIEADRLVDATKVQRTDFALAHRAKWTHRTEKTIERNAAKIIARGLKGEEEQNLASRRQRLAQMLSQEDQMYKAEIDSLKESSADRAKRLIGYARKRKEDREQKRQQFADEQIKAQWRDACDELRTIGSQISEKQTAAEIARQLEDNVRRKADTDAENARYDALWEAQRQLKNKQADEEEKKRQNFHNHIKQALTDQVTEARQRKADEARKTEEEKVAFQMRLDADDAAAKARQTAEDDQKRKEKAALAAENQYFLEQRRQQRAADKESERAIVENVLAAHRQETAQKLIDKRQMRVERLEYMDFLRQRREEEKKLEAELDRLTQAALDRDNQKRDLVMLKEELARNELMKQVQMARVDQLHEQKAAAARAAKEKALEKQLMTRELDQHRARMASEDADEKSKRAQRKVDLEKQIETNAARRDILHARTEQEHLDSKRAEAEYAAFVARERADPQKLLKRANFRRKKDGYSFGMYG